MKALVMEIRGKEAVVLKEDGSFETIKNAGYTVGASIEIKKSSGIIRFSRKFTAIAAAAAVFVLAGGVYAYAYVTPYTSYTETSDDGETEITYTVNRFDQVLDVKTSSNNDEAKPVQEISFKKFESVEKVKETTKAQIEARNEEITFTAEASEEKNEEDLAEPLKKEEIVVENDAAEKKGSELPETVMDEGKESKPESSISINGPLDNHTVDKDTEKTAEKEKQEKKTTDTGLTVQPVLGTDKSTKTEIPESTNPTEGSGTEADNSKNITNDNMSQIYEDSLKKNIISETKENERQETIVDSEKSDNTEQDNTENETDNKEDKKKEKEIKEEKLIKEPAGSVIKETTIGN